MFFYTNTKHQLNTQTQSHFFQYIYEPIAITLDNADAEEREITKLKWQLGGGLLTLVSSVIVAIIACWKYKNKVARSIVMGSFVHILEKHLQMTLIEGINRVRWIDQIGAHITPSHPFRHASANSFPFQFGSIWHPTLAPMWSRK